MLALFAISIFLGAGLLFLVQPMVGKMLLPLLGGSPGVWNTCMLFFQAALLAGYLYAHLLTKIRSRSAQVVVHVLVLAGAAAMLPVALPADHPPPGSEMPVGWLLRALLVTVGAPFFAIASAGPLLQKWFAQTSHPHARDPYFLYAASNLGSMLALVGYPLLIEPEIGLASQRIWWAAAYALFALLAVWCGVVMARQARKIAELPRGTPAVQAKPSLDVDPEVAAALTTTVTGWTRLRWVFLAFVPSSMMLGCTAYIAMDIASFPLLWVIPLSIYLLSFIIAFSPLGRWIVLAAQWTLPVAALGLVLLLDREPRHNIGWVIAAHVAGLLIASLACHGRLAAERPDASRLTEFYLWIAVGGVLGGVFNSLAAPVLFDLIAEYPIAIVLACLARPWRLARGAKTAIREWWVRFNGALDIAVPLAIGALFVAMPRLLRTEGGKDTSEWLARALETTTAWPSRWFDWWWRRVPEPDVRVALTIFVPAALCLVFVRYRLRFALCVAAIAAVPFIGVREGTKLIHVERTFFGVLRVFEDTRYDAGPDPFVWHILWHGRTMHGEQVTAAPWSYQPSTYYTRAGPVGDLFKALDGRDNLHAALVGMGTGTLAVYGKPGWFMDYYEIDPAVAAISFDTGRYFTHIRDSKAVVTKVLGDARLTLARSPGKYDLIVLDAFSSDAIPVHLVTREAVAMYLSRLNEGGLIVFHITNWYIDLEPVLGGIAKDLNLVCRHRDDDLSPDGADPMDTLAWSTSDWVVLARSEGDLGPLKDDPRWKPARTRDDLPTWTDDYTNILRVFMWK